MIPSVLHPAPTSSPNSSLNKQPYLSLPAPPTASTSATNEPQHHCSQCKRDKPESAFPLKLINLQPYLVCTLHEWYWTEQKRALHWAPEHTMSMSQACEVVRRISQGEECDDRLMIKGDEDDVKEIVDTLAKAGRYVAKKLTPRASRAKPSATEPPPPPTWLYGFRDSPKTIINKFKLTVYFHRSVGNFTMTLKPDGKQGRSDKPWARPDRKRNLGVTESRDEKKKGKEREQAYERFVPPPPSMIHDHEHHRRASEDTEFPQSLFDISTKAVSTIQDDSFDSTSSDSLSRAQRDAQQMPPPPIPPRKKARRVEPSLIAPAPLRPSSSNAFTSANSLSSSELPKPPARFTNPSTRPLDPSTSSSSTYNPPLAAPYAFHETVPSSSSSKYVSPHTLTLFEMLAMPDFDPPMIPLLPRQRAVRPTPQTQTTPSAAGRELDGLVADALGGLTPREGDSDEEEEIEGDREIDEGDYEDSIPDDSSEDDRDREGEGEGDDGIDEDGGSVSSFFESSAEESGFGSGEEEEEEEGDWLAGFVSKQMPGMGEDERDDEEEEEEESIPQPQARPERRSSKRKRGGEKKGKNVMEDEVDELDSSGKGE